MERKRLSNVRRRLTPPLDRASWIRESRVLANRWVIHRNPVQPSGMAATVTLRFVTLAEAVAVADRYGDKTIALVREDGQMAILSRDEWTKLL